MPCVVACIGVPRLANISIPSWVRPWLRAPPHVSVRCCVGNGEGRLFSVGSGCCNKLSCYHFASTNDWVCWLILGKSLSNTNNSINNTTALMNTLSIRRKKVGFIFEFGCGLLPSARIDVSLVFWMNANRYYISEALHSLYAIVISTFYPHKHNVVFKIHLFF